MAVDSELTNRFYSALGMREDIVEKQMMGGHCFMFRGNMIGGADRNAQTRYGRFMFRVGKDQEAAALAFPVATRVVQGGRSMSGMVFVDADACSDADLQSLAKLALGFIRELPPK